MPCVRGCGPPPNAGRAEPWACRWIVHYARDDWRGRLARKLPVGKLGDALPVTSGML
jgi:hypothetical protein